VVMEQHIQMVSCELLVLQLHQVMVALFTLGGGGVEMREVISL
jgi:hypothetical protein